MPPRPAALDSLRRYGNAQADVPNPDEQIAIEVHLALLRACPSLRFAVKIDARDSVVHLRGTVPSEAVLLRMYKAARTVPGIHWICNDVEVQRQPQASGSAWVAVERGSAQFGS